MRGIDQLLQLLAASGLSDRTLSEAFRQMERMDSERLVMEIQRLRKVMQRELPQFGSFVSFGFQSGLHEDVVEQVVNLLQVEARLSPGEIAARLASSIESKQGQTLPPFRPKEGLRMWLNRVARQTSSSELLHHATKIRNQSVHAPPSDWQLRQREEN